MKKFIEDLRSELKNKKMSSSTIDDIIKDHEEMIAAAKEEGMSEAEIIKKFGDPKKLAEELAYDMTDSETETENEFEKEEASPNETGFVLYQSYLPEEDFVKFLFNLVSDDMTVKPSEDQYIKVYYKKIRNISKYEIEFKHQELTIKAPKYVGFVLNLSRGDGSFLVEIPKHLTVSNYKQSSVNADITLQDQNIKIFDLNSTNGDIIVKSSKLGQTKWNTVNGDVNISESTIDEVIATHVSGDLLVKDTVILHDLKIHTVSGDIKVENSVCNHLDLSTVSGDVHGKEFYPRSVELRSVSGDIRIKNHENKPIEIIRKKSLSGTIVIEHD
jgi:hypothetical protein